MQLINVQQPEQTPPAAKSYHLQNGHVLPNNPSRLIVQSPPAGRGRAEGAGEGAQRSER
jgi:hypothetical protein